MYISFCVPNDGFFNVFLFLKIRYVVNAARGIIFIRIFRTLFEFYFVISAGLYSN